MTCIIIATHLLSVYCTATISYSVAQIYLQLYLLYIRRHASCSCHRPVPSQGVSAQVASKVLLVTRGVLKFLLHIDHFNHDHKCILLHPRIPLPRIPIYHSYQTASDCYCGVGSGVRWTACLKISNRFLSMQEKGHWSRQEGRRERTCYVGCHYAIKS